MQPKFYPNSPNIYHPHFANEEKTIVRALVRFPDGKLAEMEASRTDTASSFLRDVFAQHEEADLERNTELERRLREARGEMEKRVNEDRQKEADREALFQAKAKTMEIPQVRECPDASLPLRIRKAKSVAEVYSLAALAMLKAETR